jgi:hypothetical protein
MLIPCQLRRRFPVVEQTGKSVKDSLTAQASLTGLPGLLQAN